MIGAVVVLALAAVGADTGNLCTLCHPDIRVEFEQSIHRTEEVTCVSCHGGDPSAASVEKAHRGGFRGKIRRRDVPAVCASCHADPEIMAHYNLPTDQYTLYQTSHHGRMLAEGDDNVAVCTDCHGVHEILRGDDARSDVYPANIPKTCARCHSDAALMSSYGLTQDPYADFNASAHGEALLEGQNGSVPTCSRCHGAHGAAPPGVGDVNKVCGQCHATARSHFLESPHRAAMDEAGLPECVSCHGHHRILPADLEMLDRFCLECHEPASEPIELALQMKTLYTTASDDLDLARDLVEQAAAIPLHVDDYRTRIQEAHTALVESLPTMHSLNLDAVERLTHRARSIGHEVQSEVRGKLEGRKWRRVGLLVFWFYLIVTVAIPDSFPQARGPGGRVVTAENPSASVPASPGKRRRHRLRALLLTAGVVAGLGIVAVWTSVEISSRPRFCGSCHVMNPYYESWKESSHSNVACVECHIAPGVSAEFKKKYEALSMVASYFTGTYGTNPWTEIEDAACLECHERRLLAGKELFGDVLFDHSSHLAGMRRGKVLRCTSCHSQLVQGSHIAVTTSTCILCHFKGQPSDSGTARCTLCHHIPDKVIRHETLTLDHADVGRFGMECTWCHARPEGSDGIVPRERCVTCHNDPSRLEEYEHVELLHRMHVSEHKVDCMDCHLEIQHVGAPRIEQATAACDQCHLKGHSPQMNLYSGIGGRGVEPMPDPMFLAGVRCEGCHLEIPGESADTRRASDVSCMSCHGPSYRKIFFAWKERTTEGTAGLERQMSQTVAALRGPTPEAFQDAQFNLDLVAQGRGVHNVDYAFTLLRKSHEDMNRARSEQGLSSLPLPWDEIPYESPCLECHQGIEAGNGEIFGRSFRHEPHVINAALDCSSCHEPHEERGEEEIVRFDAAGCESCHHADSGADCLACHDDVSGRAIESFLGDFEHAVHVGDFELDCAECHDLSPGRPVQLQKEACAACHE